MKNDLAHRARQSLEHAGLNQKQVEQRAKLSLGYLSRLLHGQRSRVDALRLEQIAQVCGVDFEWLSTGQGAMLPRRGPPAREGAFDAEPAPAHGRSPTLDRESASPLEEALAEAFRQGSFALADLDDVRRIMQSGAALLRDKAHLLEAARSWLFAASALRKANTPVTFATLAWQMSTMGQARASAALEARDRELNREAREELQKLGVEAPGAPVRVPRKG